MLDAAYQAGIRYVDTARSYGMAEAFLGTWLRARNLSQDAVTIGSKWGTPTSGRGGWTRRFTKSRIPPVETLRRQIKETRALLGGWLRLYEIHSATLESGVLDDQDVLAGLVALRSEGLVIGLTVSGPRQAEAIRRALEVSVNGANPFQVVQATWNLLEPSAGPALAEARKGGWGVIVKEALANGRLTDRHWTGEITPLKIRARAHGTTTDAVALAAALAQPWADVVLWAP